MSERVYLGGLNSAWESAEIAEDRATIPDGTYTAEILKAEIKTSKFGSLFVAWDLDVPIPNEEDVVIQKVSMLSEKAMPLLKRDLRTIGVDPSLISPLDRLYDVLDYLPGTLVEFEQRTTIKDDKTYINQNFKKLISASSNPPPDLNKELTPQGYASFTDVNDNELPFS